ncbi:DUF1003 domain-containing protein [Solirhodobacter olei]|uniref:DUF1003 domain-containing protein n=1 Tax=Solirhodobacter olei TaxID=2493082 RepID=UPI000FDB60B5|nr:DUF1003 domain-containing protein [Solirhodobacter olei]
MSEHHDSNSAEDTGPCAVCGGTFPTRELRGTAGVRPGIMELIRKDHPGIGSEDHICRADLARYRRLYLEELLEEERGELSELDREVIESIETGELVTQNPEEEIDETMTFGQRMADHVAAFGGSWTFILTFLAVLMGWIAINSLSLLTKPFDPYPYILLNLVLSCIAAIQAPIIMMSQGRQEQKDRMRSENDYQVNLKAELEIRQLHERLDYQMARQWEKLAELQRLQIEYLEARTEADEAP